MRQIYKTQQAWEKIFEGILKSSWSHPPEVILLKSSRSHPGVSLKSSWSNPPEVILKSSWSHPPEVILLKSSWSHPDQKMKIVCSRQVFTKRTDGDLHFLSSCRSQKTPKSMAYNYKSALRYLYFGSLKWIRTCLDLCSPKGRHQTPMQNKLW